jgi:hypothetical protein
MMNALEQLLGDLLGLLSERLPAVLLERLEAGSEDSGPASADPEGFRGATTGTDADASGGARPTPSARRSATADPYRPPHEPTPHGVERSYHSPLEAAIAQREEEEPT